MGSDQQELDMMNRDPNGLHESLTVQFHDVFGEPEGAHSSECAYTCGYKCYEGSRNCCYKVLTALCTWYYGCCWGCEFACLTFNTIWYYTPMVKSFSIVATIFSRMCNLYLSVCVAPCCAAIGMMFSNIKVTQSAA